MIITIDEIFNILFQENWKEVDSPCCTIAHEIKDELYFEVEVSVELANWIDEEGYGCIRPNQIDEDDPNYDPSGTEVIEIYAEDYIEANFKNDFLSSFNNDDYVVSEEEIYSYEEVEGWINDSIQRAIAFFNNFTAADTDSGAPEDLSLNLKYDKKIILNDLNSKWSKDATYQILGFEDIPEGDNIF